MIKIKQVIFYFPQFSKDRVNRERERVAVGGTVVIIPLDTSQESSRHLMRENMCDAVTLES